ncbi:hypothetical protein B7486_42265 [cyanobacterium TDX16]|nr:hypothetical protein B7486_42265 [cyanobacterium TDX16]
MAKFKVLTDYDLEYVCELSFDDLEGTSRVQRYCRVCHCTVHNLAMYTEEGRRALIDDANVTRKRLCVTASTRRSDSPSCSTVWDNSPMGFLRKRTDNPKKLASE